MQTIPYSKKVGDWLQVNSGCTLLDYCRKFHYYSIATKIMGLDETNVHQTKLAIARDKELKPLYLKYSKDPKAISYKGENRSWTQYFKDLITGWVMEDLFMEMLTQQGIEIHHNGKDAKREISVDGLVRQDADFIVKVGESSRLLELTSEFNSLLNNRGYIEKRAPALFHLWKSKGIWLYRDLIRGKYVMIDFATEPIVLHLRHHTSPSRAWSKDVHRYVLLENNKRERDDRLLLSEIIAVVGCKLNCDGAAHNVKEIIDEDAPPQIYNDGGLFKSELKKRAKPDGERQIVQTHQENEDSQDVVIENDESATSESDDASFDSSDSSDDGELEMMVRAEENAAIDGIGDVDFSNVEFI